MQTDYDCSNRKNTNEAIKMMVINILGILLIGLIIYWFWLYQGKEVVVEGDIVIDVVDGTYQPSRIRIPANQPATLIFNRRDQSPCSATLLIPKLEISDDLPLGKKSSIVLPGLEKGEYEFHCQMQMYKGVIHVE